MSVSVIIPTRNRKVLLRKLVNNLLENFKQVDQIIIIDSSDDSEQKANFLTNIKVLYIHSEIRSAAIQRNIGLSLLRANCNYVAFLDDDVIPPTNYFIDLIALLKDKKAAGVSGIAVNLNSHKSGRILKFFEAYRRFFYLDSSIEGVVLNSGVNIPVKRISKANIILECKWLIGCAVWDYQKIRGCQFDNRFYGQSLGEDVLFSLKASKHGKLFVKRNLILKHLESSIGRPNYLIHNRMWVRNRFYISQEILGEKFKTSYHWCNFGKFLSFLLLAPKRPFKSIFGSFGMLLGILDVIKEKHAR